MNQGKTKSRHRVVITGIGCVTPLGLDVRTTWSSLLGGQSGIGIIDRFDVQKFPSRIGGLVKKFDPRAYFEPTDARRTEPFVQYGVAAAVEACEQAHLKDGKTQPSRIGVIMGSGIGGLSLIEEQRDLLLNEGPIAISPVVVPQCIINMIAGYVSVLVNAQGPSFATVSACSSGTHAIIQATRLIERGDIDIAIAGSSENAVTPLSLAGFSAARALSQQNDDPSGASKPWDRNRDGFVLADGAGALVLESLESAQKRGVPMIAEILGCGCSSDAFHPTSPPPDGNGAARCMLSALDDGGIAPSDVDYINAHATSTRKGDLAEARALRSVFGSNLKNVAISSTKSATGHLLGASGSVEAVFSALAIRDQVAPPTINTKAPDDECTFDFVPKKPRKRMIRRVLTNSFGFGGTNASILLGRFST